MKPLVTPRRRRGEGRALRALPRRQPRTRRRWTWRSLLHAPIPQLAVLALVLGGGYGLATSSAFSITTMQTTGDPSVPRALLQNTCVCMGANIFLTRPDTIRQRLASIPWIQVRQVYERLPNRIVVDAAYRQPAVLWRTHVATYTVDASGMVLYDVKWPPVAPAMVPTTRTVPLVLALHGTTFTSGQQVDPTGVAVPMVLATRAGLARDIAPSVDTYRWSSVSGLAGHSRIGWWFLLGINLHQELQDRLNILASANKRGIMQRSHCNYIDLQVKAYPYCRYSLDWHQPNGPGW